MICGGVIDVHCENRVKEVEIDRNRIQIFWRICILAKRAHLLRQVCSTYNLSALISSHSMDFHKILYWSLLLKYVEKI
jgi:hypothetical protein